MYSLRIHGYILCADIGNHIFLNNPIGFALVDRPIGYSRNRRDLQN